MGRIWGDHVAAHVPYHLNNLFNPEMNNINAIDYRSLDPADADGVLSRYTQEYPRQATSFRKKTDSKPWGDKSEPKLFDFWQDSRFRSE